MNASSIETRMAVLENKQTESEKRLYALELKEAVVDEQYKTVINRLDKIDGHVNKLVWLALTSLAVPIFNFVMNGGLKPFLK